MDCCRSKLPSRSKYEKIQSRVCQRPKGHAGPHDEFPFVRELEVDHIAVARKIIRDSIMTTGAAWKSEEAGPNRVLRWVMLLRDNDLKRFGIDMDKLKPQVVAKLREKAARYEDCLEVAKKLTWLVYQMPDAPTPSAETRRYLEEHFGPMKPGATTCLVCGEPLSFKLFAQAVRGKAAIETGHANPREHTSANVGFSHRECNIAQGSKTLAEFYKWIAEILTRARPQRS